MIGIDVKNVSGDTVLPVEFDDEGGGHSFPNVIRPK